MPEKLLYHLTVVDRWGGRRGSWTPDAGQGAPARPFTVLIMQLDFKYCYEKGRGQGVCANASIGPRHQRPTVRHCHLTDCSTIIFTTIMPTWSHKLPTPSLGVICLINSSTIITKMYFLWKSKNISSYPSSSPIHTFFDIW